jgi:hypothetical protein
MVCYVQPAKALTDQLEKNAISAASVLTRAATRRSKPSYTSVGVAAAARQGARTDIDVTLPPPHGATLLPSPLLTRTAQLTLPPLSGRVAPLPLYATAAHTVCTKGRCTPVTLCTCER